MNKRLIAIFVCMAIFVVTLVVGTLVFTVEDVTILIPEDATIAFDKAKILDTSGIKKGQSVFVINKEKAKASIEKQFPTLKVTDIERVPPNKVRIHLNTRVPIFKIRLGDSDDFAILDREFKVVAIDKNSDSDGFYEDNKIVTISGYLFDADEGCLGDFIGSEACDIANLKTIVNSLEKLQVVNERIPATFDHFQFKSQDNDEFIELKTALGAKIVIRTNIDIPSASNDLEYQCDKLYSMFYAGKDMTGNDINREENKYLFFHNTRGPVWQGNLDFES